MLHVNGRKYVYILTKIVLLPLVYVSMNVEIIMNIIIFFIVRIENTL